jgi:HAD superfamily hydrolase (TIGR01509 family)
MGIDLSEHSFDAIIFDNDGTLVHSMPLHFVAWAESFRQHGSPFEFSEEYFYTQAGIAEVDTVKALNAMHSADLDPHAVMKTKMEIFYARMGDLQVVESVAAVARQLHGSKPFAVASGSEEHTVRECLSHTGLLPMFPIIIPPKDVKHGKPAPDMFLLAAEKMAVDPARCIVFEDGRSGAIGAQAAGMKVVWVSQEGALSWY